MEGEHPQVGGSVIGPGRVATPSQGDTRWIKVLMIMLPTLGTPLAVLGYGVYREFRTRDKVLDDRYVEISWRDLRQLDYQTGQIPELLAKLDGAAVKIPGFVVPLDDDVATFSEFLLVPNPQACIHVPPPPPNQMIMVVMKADNAPQRSWGPVWIKGKLYMATSDSQYGKISFQMRGEEAERYSSDAL